MVAERAESPVVHPYEASKDLFTKVGQWQGLKQLPGGPKALSFRFVPRDIARQRARSIPRKGSDFEQYLYIRELGYDPGEKSLGIGLVIFDLNRGSQTLALNAHIPATPEQDAALQRSWEEFSLIAEFTGTLSSVPEPKAHADGCLEFYGHWRAPSLRLLSDDQEIHSGAAALRDGAFLSPHYRPAKMRDKLRQKSVLEIQAEDLSGLIYFSDWERHEIGWYGRELKETGGTGIAAIHEKNMNAVAVHRFDGKRSANPVVRWPGFPRMVRQPARAGKG